VAKLLPFSSDIFQPLTCSSTGFYYTCFYLGPWIGGFNVTAPNTFQWVTGEPVSYTNWPQGFLVPAGRQIAYELSWNLDFDSTSLYWETPAPDGVRPIAYVAEHRQTQALLFLTQTTVAGCKTVTGTVLLPRPAPSAGHGRQPERHPPVSEHSADAAHPGGRLARYFHDQDDTGHRT
jgi:hypothetical protein